MNRLGYYYEVVYRLDDIEDYDNTEYSGELNSKKEVKKFISSLIKEYSKRIVMLDIHKYDEDELLDAETII